MDFYVKVAIQYCRDIDVPGPAVAHRRDDRRPPSSPGNGRAGIQYQFESVAPWSYVVGAVDQEGRARR